jgi:hypothetical protein
MNQYLRTTTTLTTPKKEGGVRVSPPGIKKRSPVPIQQKRSNRSTAFKETQSHALLSCSAVVGGVVRLQQVSANPSADH